MNRLNIQPYVTSKDTILPKSSVCPYCNTKLDMTSGVTGNNPEDRQPSVGDISICIKCGEPCRFGEGMEMVKLPDDIKREIMEDPVIAKATAIIKSSYQEVSKQKDAYVEQIEKMTSDVKEWLKTNKLSPAIQYNFSEKAFVIASLPEALEQHAISVNDDAMRMFHDLGWIDGEGRMPTIFMVKIAMEHVFKEPK